VKRRRRVGELGHSEPQRNDAGRASDGSLARLPRNSIASVTSARFVRRSGRGREGDRADRKSVEPCKSRVGHCAGRSVEYIRVSTYAVLKSSDKMSESTDNLPTKYRNLPIRNPAPKGQTGHKEFQRKISTTRRNAAFVGEMTQRKQSRFDSRV
jgi:hypothetical protein